MSLSKGGPLIWFDKLTMSDYAKVSLLQTPTGAWGSLLPWWEKVRMRGKSPSPQPSPIEETFA